MSHWDEIENELQVVDEYLYGERVEEEEFWLGERNLTEVIK